MPSVFVYSIAYSQQCIADLEAGYRVLDNLANPRPDWREYWPIRNFLLTHPLEEGAWYGFFSPRFREKTGLSYEQMRAFVAAAGADADVVTFSPQVDIGAFFPNVFVGGEMADPGFLAASQALAERIGLQVSLRDLVMDSRTTVFSNFVVARPAYWRQWLALCEKLYALAESDDAGDPLGAQLRHQTRYREGVERKVFVMEGMASLLLTLDADLRVRPYDPFSLGWSAQLSRFKQEAIVCDALKTAIRVHGHPAYAETFEQIRQQVLRSAFGRPQDKPMKQTPAHDLYNDTILQMLPPGLKRVAEVGCMRGTLARVYGEKNPDCEWIGMDIDPDNVEAARAVCRHTLCCDIETVPTADLMQWGAIDAWVFGDILEHLRDPWALLSRIRATLSPNGVVVASIPNAQHWSFQARLNAGQFRYEDEGLFDRTHLRFFTRTTILEMFLNAGYRIDQAVSRIIHSPDAEKYLPHIRAMASASGLDPDTAATDALAFQYVVKAAV